MTTDRRNRIQSIDMLRGLVMVIMALDHVRDYFHYDAYFFDPTDLSKTNVALFFTRFITHYCAPVFVFLAGTSAFFIGQKRDKKSLSIWLLKRGVWLVFAELTIIKLAWMFKLDYTSIVLQVIWVLGISMIFLAGLIYLPKKVGLPLALLVVFGHNLLDGIAPQDPFYNGVWSFLHTFNLIDVGFSKIFIGYPMIPWIFVMLLGYYFGTLYLKSVETKTRVKRLYQLGLGMTALFFVLRGINIYGDPVKWAVQDDFSLTVLSFFNVAKYPPSLLYLLITLGPSILFLAAAENWKGWMQDRLVVVGRVPMFFYIIHLYVIHFFAVIAAMVTGFSFSDMMIDVWVTLQPQLQGYGFNLGIVYLLWVIIVLGLYPICHWYNNYKTENRDKWWLSYL